MIAGKNLSETSYAFALTYELVKLFSGQLKGIPIFPTQVEEAVLGYDVNFEEAGVPLILQFKRSTLLKTNQAKEIKVSKAGINPPFYRFHLHQTSVKKQHENLIKLCGGTAEVLYAAPEFTSTIDLHNHFSNNSIIENSVFISPMDIGLISNSGKHTVAFEKNKDTAWVCSEPSEISRIRIKEILYKAQTKLEQEVEPIIVELKKVKETLIANDNQFSREYNRIRNGPDRNISIKTYTSDSLSINEMSSVTYKQTIDDLYLEPKWRTLLDLRTLTESLVKVYNAQLFILQRKK
ncbi:MAG: hypothetical protein H6912_10590 [Kordiimonadaceae bacterium]|nr:hypothetical protein [Kordiimonadaceae bacterium]